MALSKFFRGRNISRQLMYSFIKPVLYVVTSNKNTSRPVAYKTIPTCASISFELTINCCRTVQHTLFSQRQRMSVYTCTGIKYFKIITHGMTAQHAGLSYKRFNLIRVYFSVQYSARVFYCFNVYFIVSMLSYFGKHFR